MGPLICGHFSIVILSNCMVPGGLNSWMQRNHGYRGLPISNVQINFPPLFKGQLYFHFSIFSFGWNIWFWFCLLEFAQQIFLDFKSVRSPIFDGLSASSHILAHYLYLDSLASLGMQFSVLFWFPCAYLLTAYFEYHLLVSPLILNILCSSNPELSVWNLIHCYSLSCCHNSLPHIKMPSEGWKLLKVLSQLPPKFQSHISNCLLDFSTEMSNNVSNLTHLKFNSWDLPGGSLAKTPHFQCRGSRFNP